LSRYSVFENVHDIDTRDSKKRAYQPIFGLKNDLGFGKQKPKKEGLQKNICNSNSNG